MVKDKDINFQGKDMTERIRGFKRYKSSSDKPTTELAYIDREQKKLERIKKEHKIKGESLKG